MMKNIHWRRQTLSERKDFLEKKKDALSRKSFIDDYHSKHNLSIYQILRYIFPVSCSAAASEKELTETVTDLQEQFDKFLYEINSTLTFADYSLLRKQ